MIRVTLSSVIWYNSWLKLVVLWTYSLVFAPFLQDARIKCFHFLQNVPTLGVSALNLASLLCDEVSLAGFGYNLPHQNVPLHYYDHQPIGVMQKQTMHNVDTETRLLQSLVKGHTITDLTGGIYCSFCSSWPRPLPTVSTASLTFYS